MLVVGILHRFCILFRYIARQSKWCRKTVGWNRYAITRLICDFFSGVRSNLVLSGVFAPHIHFVVCVSKLQVGIATHPNLEWKTTGNVWTVLKIKPPVPTITPSIATVEHERHAIVSLLCCAPNNDLPQTLKLRPHHSTKENGNNSGYQQQKQKKTGQRKETNTHTKWG